MRKFKLYNDNIAYESSLNEGGFFWALSCKLRCKLSVSL